MAQDMLYLFENPQIYLFTCLAAIVLLILLIIKSVAEKNAFASNADEALASSSDAPMDGKPPEKVHETPSDGDLMPEGGDDDSFEDEPRNERERLERIECELAEKRRKLQAEKIADLKARESQINMKRAEELSESGGLQDSILKLTEEKRHLEELIKKAEKRFEAQEIEEKNFKMIVSEYHDSIIDIDIQIKKARGSGI